MAEQNVNVTQNATNIAMAGGGCFGCSGCIFAFVAIVLVSLAYEYWYVTLPLVAIVLFAGWQVRQKQQEQADNEGTR